MKISHMKAHQPLQFGKYQEFGVFKLVDDWRSHPTVEGFTASHPDGKVDFDPVNQRRRKNTGETPVSVFGLTRDHLVLRNWLQAAELLIQRIRNTAPSAFDWPGGESNPAADGLRSSITQAHASLAKVRQALIGQFKAYPHDRARQHTKDTNLTDVLQLLQP